MDPVVQPEGAAATPPLHPLRLTQGCNTPEEVVRAQVEANIQRDVAWLDYGGEKDRPLCIVAGGPSLKETWPQLLGMNADIMALNGAYPFLTERGITPDYFMLLDARPDNISFLRDPRKATIHYLAAQCHPDIFDALDSFAKVLYLTTVPYAKEVTEGIDKPKLLVSGVVGTVGVKAISLAYILGYRELHLYGYDSSYEDYHHAYPQPLNDASTVMEVAIEPGGKLYRCSPSMAQQAKELTSRLGEMSRLGLDINIHGYGLLPDLVAHAMKRGEQPLEEREREKYEAVWAEDKYREHNPGEHHVGLATLKLGIERGDTLIDFGCGTGRGARLFIDRGIKAKGVDFARNALDADIPFVNACLWDMPEMLADWGYCTDVMEHIPTEKVDAVLAGIAARTRYGVYFNIATRDDVMGGRIGRRLHMTVMDAEQWEKMLQRHWYTVKTVYSSEGEVAFAVTGRKKEA